MTGFVTIGFLDKAELDSQPHDVLVESLHECQCIIIDLIETHGPDIFRNTRLWKAVQDSADATLN